MHAQAMLKMSLDWKQRTTSNEYFPENDVDFVGRSYKPLVTSSLDPCDLVPQQLTEARVARILLLSIGLALVIFVVVFGCIWLYAAARKYLNKDRLAIQEEKQQLLEIQSDIDFAANQLEKTLQRNNMKDTV